MQPQQTTLDPPLQTKDGARSVLLYSCGSYGGAILIESALATNSKAFSLGHPHKGAAPKFVSGLFLCATRPYLGSVVLGSPASGESNPSVGEVVVVGSVPAGEADPFLGAIEEGS